MHPARNRWQGKLSGGAISTFATICVLTTYRLKSGCCRDNTKAQFANSPTLSKEIMNAVLDALEAHTTMSKQAIASERVREGLKDVLLGPAQLYEALKDKAGEQAIEGSA